MLLLFVANDITLIVLVNIGRRLEPAANQSANSILLPRSLGYSLLAGWIHSFSRVSMRSFLGGCPLQRVERWRRVGGIGVFSTGGGRGNLLFQL